MSSSHPSSGGPPTSTPTTRRSAAASQAASAQENESNHPPPSNSTPTNSSHPRSRSEAMERRSGASASQASSQAGPSGTSSSATTGAVANVGDCEVLAARLLDPQSDVKTKLAIATDLRESVEQFRDVDYGRYLDILLPAFTEVLRKGTPVFVKDSGEQKLRHTLLEIIQRLPHNDFLKPFSDQIMTLMLHLLRTENEDNGVICIKIVIDHNRAFKDEVEKHVREFLELVKEMYGNLKEVVREEFGIEGELPKTTKSSEDASKTLRPSLHSFKVLTECPIAVVLVFQTWKTIVFPYIKDYFPLVMECLTLQAEPQRLAYLAAAEKGELFVGVSDGIKNRELYTELIVAQVKTMSFLAYVLRTATDDIKKHAATMAEASIRLLRDCPPESVASRKELLVATRHILSTDFRQMYISQIDTMLDERVLVGTGITSQEALRPLAYSMLADLVHHVRADLTIPQLSKIIHIYSCCLHEPAFTFGIQTMCAKLLLNLIETVCVKVDKADSPKFLLAILECSIDKLAAIESIHGQLKDAYGKGLEKETPKEEGEKGKGKEVVKDGEKGKEGVKERSKSVPDWLLIERAKPVHAVSYIGEGTEAYSRDLYFLVDARYLVKTLLHGIRALLNQIRVLGAAPPDGALLGKLFEAETRLLAYYDPVKDLKDEKEALDLFSQILLHFDPHVFAEIWTTKMDFFMEQAIINHHVLTVPQSLLVPLPPPQQAHSNGGMTHIQEVSHQLVAILLNYLTKGLPTFGDQDKKHSALSLKLFKLAFMAVNAYPEHNEPVLVPHLAKLITDCFSYAANATDSTIYYSILRALFRSIGGGRFEALYKEVLPILQEMLDTLNHLLLHAEPDKRDLFVELSLTVPVRLTNLLPHLGYLMQPLVHALRAGPELVSQGLRTLELCIDNLTAEFFDPTLGPVLRDLMAALHDLLKPVPFNHHHSHATVKILGKLGGRNRRFQQAPHLLEYNIPAAVDATMPISFDGHSRNLAVLPIVELAVKSVKSPTEYYRAQAVEFLKQSAMMIAEQGVRGSEQELVFHQTVEGLFTATLYPELKESTIAFLRKLSRHVFGLELRRESPSREWRHNQISPLTNSYLEATALALASLPAAEFPAGEALFKIVVDDILDREDVTDAMQQDRSDPAIILDSLWTKFSSLCFEESWKRKLAGCTGLSVLTTKEGISPQWIVDHQLDFFRPLFFVLKDMPSDPPKAVGFVVKVIKNIIESCNKDLALAGPSARSKLVQTLIREFASTNRVVRETSQWCIEALASYSDMSVHDLLAPVKGLLLTPIFDKPLRALPFPMQIGNIEAITYCLNLQPPLPEIGEELVRLLHEAIALADAEDRALIGQGAQHRLQVSLKNLRISCLKLLAAAMACTDFFVKQSPVRSRVISVYFKHVYSATPEIMLVAHNGLRAVLAHQQKLPKEVLQSGLRPILANLADARRLSVAGLEGLARFLELLTNYFKVEIGHKLLDHFRTLSEEGLQVGNSALVPFDDNQDIIRMVRLLNVIRLLPITANRYLPEVIPLVVDAETNLHQSVPGPFTENLARFLDRYPDEAIPYLFENLRNVEIVRTFRHILGSGWAPDIIKELSARAGDLGEVCFSGKDASPDLVTPGLLLVRELIAQDPKWLVNNTPVLDSLLLLWRASPSRLATSGEGRTPSTTQREPLYIVEIFISYLKYEQHVPLLFEVIRIYTLHTSADLSRVTAFLYENIAAGSSTQFKREILTHFLGVFGDSEVPWDFKMHTLRLLINPILLVFFSRDEPVSDLIDHEFLNNAHSLIWGAVVSNDRFLADAGDALKIELLRMSTLLVQHCSELLSDQRKDVIKMGWVYIKDPDPTVKHTAYLLISRFIENNDCPTKIVMQVWSGLLKLPPTEGRVLVRKAIDIVAPVLPIRVARAANAAHPPWAVVVRKVLVEEGHSIPVLIAIFELIVSHADLFYESRELFVPQMVSSLPRLGSAANSTSEMKKLSVDIAELVLRWEQRRTGRGASKGDVDASGKRPSDGDLPSPKRSRIDRAGTAVSTSSGGGWAPAVGLRESIVSYLVRLVSTSPEPIASRGLCNRAFELLTELLGPTPWSPVSIKLNFFQRTLVTVEHSDQNLGVVANSAQALALIANAKPDAFFISQMGLFQKLLEKSIVGDHSILHDSLRPILERMFEVLPPPRAALDEPEPEELTIFRDWADGTIAEGLKTGNGLKGTLFILQCWSKTRSDKIELYSGPLVKTLNKLAKDHISPTPHLNHPQQQQQQQSAPISDLATTELVLSILELCRHRVQDLKDQRRWLLSAFVQLIEKSSSMRVCRFVLEMLRGWVMDSQEAFPTHKEKAGLLMKMVCFDKKDDPKLLLEYLQLIYDIYNEPSLRRTELTTRLETAFLLGTRVSDPHLRSKFIDLFDQSLPSSLGGRLQYVLASQSWEPLASGYWIHQALDLLLGCVDADTPLLPSLLTKPTVEDAPKDTLLALMKEAKVGDYLSAARRLLHTDDEVAHKVWISVFKTAWATLSKPHQSDTSRHLVALLAKEHHLNQIDMRPNVVQTLLEGVLASSPPIVLPPFVVKYLGKSFDAWHTAIELMNNSLSLEPVRSDEGLKDTTRDGLAELFADLCEDDLFYGLWRRRSVYAETNAALSYEQNGMWPMAQVMYETAQIKARTGVLPFTEPEYCLWEDHWILSAQKLQQWDILTDLARSENNHDLLLECAWRLSDWGSVDRETIESTLAAVSDVATPRRKVFEAYTCLIKAQSHPEKSGEFVKILDEAFQLSIRKWVSLPKAITMAHVPLLQLFQQYVELQEASQVFDSLAMTNAQNLEFRVSHDLKGIFTTWRERLPNFWDDISVWSDLLAWRQHVFSAVTKVYVPLIPPGETATYGYRGYHETAWMINRFGHVARKHQLHEVCANALNKIYALPNIEISEAFLKLREQAMSHYQKADKLAEGLESISTTNLMYFASAQKAEFLTLKGMFIAKLGHDDDANQAFAAAVQQDLNLSKAWAEWGRFNDRIFRQKPLDPTYAANAVSCYLQAAGLYKNRKTRKLLVRVLWLLSLDDVSNGISKAFESYKGEMPIWYWITLVPQLLLSLSHREARHARTILMKIAKIFPQSLFYQLRTTREDFEGIRKQHMIQLARVREKEAAAQAAAAAALAAANPPPPTSDAPASSTRSATGADASATSDPSAAPDVPLPPPLAPNASGPRQPWELVDDLLNILKTAFPLLALSMEKMVDQIQTRGKCPFEEDIYRFITALLMDGMAQYIYRSDKINDDGKLSPATIESVGRFAQNVTSHSKDLRKSLEDDLMSEVYLRDYVRKLQRWRDKYELQLDRRPRKQALDQGHCYLSEFHHGKFDEVEIPGQYLQHVDSHSEFAKIARFSPTVELGRGNGFCFRRITMVGHDGSHHTFSVQLPAARHTRREDRISQIFRTLSTVLQSRKESRKRNLSFHLPAAIPLAPSLRLLELDNSYSSFQDIYDAHCREKGLSKEDPILHITDRFRALFDPSTQAVGSSEYVNLRVELLDEVETKFVPKTVLSDYMIRLMKTPSDLFLMRKQFTLQMASVTFISYVAALQQRTLPRFNISKATGLIYMSELLPFSTKFDQPPLLHNDDPVDFRLTPNIQHFMTLTGIEGILTASLVAIGRGLCQPEFDLEEQLSLYMKDEVYHMINVLKRRPLEDMAFRNLVWQNVDVFTNKVKVISCQYERDRGKGDTPVTQAVITLINKATNRQNLARLAEGYCSFF